MKNSSFKRIEVSVYVCVFPSFLLIVNTSLINLWVPVHRYEGALDPWMSSLWNTLYLKYPKLLPKGPDAIANMNLMDQPKFQIIYHDIDGLDSQYSAITGK